MHQRSWRHGALDSSAELEPDEFRRLRGKAILLRGFRRTQSQFRRPIIRKNPDLVSLEKNTVGMNIFISEFQQSIQYGKNAKACPFNRGNRAIAPRHSPLAKSKPTTSSRATQ